MTSLNPTPTRLAVLEAVAAGRVQRHVGGVYIDTTFAVRRRVTKTIEEMIRAGWLWRVGTGPLQITDQGRAILAGGER